MFILHAHVKSINATVMGTQILVRGRWSSFRLEEYGFVSESMLTNDA